MKKINNIQHLAIIMDGNGRWAKAKNLPRTSGHKVGADKVTDVIKYATKFNIKYLTLYAFSTENWKRPELEVNFLMQLLSRFIDEKINELMENGVVLKVQGRLNGLPSKIAQKLQEAIDKTANNSTITLILALNYGGRAEIVDTTQKIADMILNNEIKVSDIDEKFFASQLYLPEIPDPELIIRTSGEFRLSNFLLWELAYSEIYITNTLWPDFNELEFENAIKSFYNRERRLGGV